MGKLAKIARGKSKGKGFSYAPYSNAGGTGGAEAARSPGTEENLPTAEIAREGGDDTKSVVSGKSKRPGAGK